MWWTEQALEEILWNTYSISESLNLLLFDKHPNYNSLLDLIQLFDDLGLVALKLIV